MAVQCIDDVMISTELTTKDRARIEYLRLGEGFHVRAVTAPDQRRGWCSGDVALNLNVVPDSRGYVIHFEGFIQRYYRYTCTD